MALTFDAPLQSTLNAQANKTAWANALNTALGPTRILRMKHDANSGPDPWTSGTEFQSVNMTGSLTVTAGAVTGFGTAVGFNMHLAQTITGTAVLRIEGNGHYLQGMLAVRGTPAAALADFLCDATFTTTAGTGFVAGASVRPPKFLPSGTGPAAPAKLVTMASAIRLSDWTNPASPVVVGTAAMTARDEDFVLQDAEVSASMGDIAVYQTPTDITWGNFTVGATLLLADQSTTEVGNIPLQQVLVAWKYNGAWNNYPEQTSYTRSMVLNPPPFKVELLDGNGNVIYTWQMHDGKAINDPTLKSGNNQAGRGGRDASNPLQPQFNCAMMLPWQNTRPRMSDLATKIYPGNVGWRETMCKTQSSLICVEPLITGGYGGNSLNGLGHFFYQDKWPLPYAPLTITDPNLDGHMNASGSSAQYAGWATGYGYEPGSYAGHHWYTSPGGPRPDRSIMPSQLAYWMSNPTGTRAQGNVPRRDIAEGYTLGYFNHSNHWVVNASSLQTIPNAEVLADTWCFTGEYYGQYARPKQINLNADQRDGTTAANYDSAGNMVYNGWGRDPLHAYTQRGWGALLLNSPMHAITSKHDTITGFLTTQDPNRNMRGTYMVRTMAWEWFNYAMAWKLASAHRLGFTQQEIETRFATMLEAIYRDVYAPVFINNENSEFANGLRNLGVPIYVDQYNYWATNGGWLGFYMAHCLQFMKQTGFWSRIHSKGGHQQLVLDNLIRNMDKYNFDFMLDYTGYANTGYNSFGPASAPYPNPASWAAYKQYQITNNDPNQYNDFQHVTSGSTNGVYAGDIDVSAGMWRQYAYIRRDYFPEIACARTNGITDTIAKFAAYETITTNAVAAATDAVGRIQNDHYFQYPSIAIIAPPTSGKLGPA